MQPPRGRLRGRAEAAADAPVTRNKRFFDVVNATKEQNNGARPMPEGWGGERHEPPRRTAAAESQCAGARNPLGI